MDAVPCPFITHKLENLNPLLEVEILLGGNHIDVLVEVVGFLSVYRSRDIPCDVEC